VVVIADKRPKPRRREHGAEGAQACSRDGTAAEDVAKTLSADGVTVRVVDLGWVQKGDLDPELDRAAWALQKDQVTAPVQGRGGLHVVKQLDHRAAALRPFDEVKEQIQGVLEQQRMGAEYGKYLRELEQRSYIALTVPPEAEGFRGLAEGQTSPFGQGLGEVAGGPPPEATQEQPAPPPGPVPAGAPTTVPNGKPAPESPTGARRRPSAHRSRRRRPRRSRRPPPPGR
jgi:hypothetical protein